MLLVKFGDVSMVQSVPHLKHLAINLSHWCMSKLHDQKRFQFANRSCILRLLMEATVGSSRKMCKTFLLQTFSAGKNTFGVFLGRVKKDFEVNHLVLNHEPGVFGCFFLPTYLLRILRTIPTPFEDLRPPADSRDLVRHHWHR